MRSLFSLLLILTLVYLAVAVYFYFAQASLVYFPSRVLIGSPADIGLDFENVRMETDDGEQLHGWFIPSAKARYTLLFLHGNAGNISHRLESLRLYHQMGFSVFIPDYRGYGKSSGSPTEKGTYLDAKAAWRYLREQRGLRPEQIVVFGRSLGGGVATWLASTYPPGALILESTFTSVPDLGAEFYPWLPVRLLARIHYSSLHRIRAVSSPVLVIHSAEDRIVPLRHGQRLYDAAGGRKSFLEIQGDHNGGFLDTGAAYTRGILHFIELLNTTGFSPPHA